eukprot:10637800-Prorocentrum_lima.AAC.1
MTSSLVGSEMCIRDRHLAVCRMQLWAARIGFFAGEVAARALWARCGQSLSLIHILTLPTICSV